MSKYISEDILLEDLWDSKCESDMLRRVRQAIVDEISGIEGIDIVRCGECKYTDGEPPIADGRLWCRKHYSYMYYCSDGERNE